MPEEFYLAIAGALLLYLAICIHQHLDGKYGKRK